MVPLAGRARLGIVVATQKADDRAREEVLSIAAGLHLPADLVELCGWVSEAAAISLAAVLRAALPPGIDATRYRVLHPAPGWPWKPDSLVGRATLRRALGDDGFRAAEVHGRIELAPGTPDRATVEWAVLVEGAEPDLVRAPRQRELFAVLRRRGGACTTSALVREARASRSVLRQLVRKGAVRLVRHPPPPPIFRTRGSTATDRTSGYAERVVERGGAWLWRTPSGEQPDVVASLVYAAVRRGDQALILAPEIRTVERVVRHLRSELPAGHTVAPYHSNLDRAAVYEAAYAGDVDVLVGTRAAALLPLARLGAICVVDEPNESHRAQPGYEGLPIHVRDVALARARVDGACVLYLSPFPSLRLYAPEVRQRYRITEIPARRSETWPRVRIVDTRSSGAILSQTLIDACQRGGRVGVVANRLGYATTIICNQCGAVRSCRRCGLPLALHEGSELLVCGRCGIRDRTPRSCEKCGSERSSPTGLAVERVREDLANHLNEQVGLLTAGRSELADAPVVVGTARRVLEEEWDVVILPDADSLLLAASVGATERAFRMLYAAAETARDLLLVQTRLPEHYALRAAVRGDYPAFAAAELPRLRALGYPPFAHLTSVTFQGPESTIRRAVESRLRPVLEPKVEVSPLVPLAREGEPPAWRVLLRSRERSVAARAGTLAARLAAETRRLKVRVDVDPEEV